MDALSAALLLIASFSGVSCYEKIRKLKTRKFSASLLIFIMGISIVAGWNLAGNAPPPQETNALMIAGSLCMLGLFSVASIISPYIWDSGNTILKNQSKPVTIKLEEMMVSIWASLGFIEIVGLIIAILGVLIFSLAW